MKKIISIIIITALLTILSACAEEIITPTRGSWNGNTFTSEYMELRLVIPEHPWRIYSDYEIAQQRQFYEYEIDFFVRQTQTESSIALTFKRLHDDDFCIHEYLEACGTREAETFAAINLTATHTIETTPLAGIEWITKRTEIRHEAEVIALQIHLASIESGYLRCLHFRVHDDAHFQKIASWFSWHRGATQ
ncbi:MAG: hypothetical protein FWC89_08085 [Defluviitaleaceae bacterium]|nr:hypothetical protein [Defluviitaleaceae bacterium]